jgi:hypothetical protein
MIKEEKNKINWKELNIYVNDEMKEGKLFPSTSYIDIQFCGWCVRLLPNGTYFTEDTTGG